MNIDIKDTLTLDDNNKYIVISKITKDNIDYYYLIDKNNYKNIMFCYIDNDELVKISDNKLISNLLPLFLEKIKDEIL